MLSDNPAKIINDLTAQNNKLLRALSGLMCWAGCSPDGPSGATPEAKKRNREMYEEAVREASSCFPEHFGGFHDDDRPSPQGAMLN